MVCGLMVCDWLTNTDGYLYPNRERIFTYGWPKQTVCVPVRVAGEVDGLGCR
jgi:hypothetical protein